MKKEEQLLRALGNVKDSYILEVSPYLGNPQRDVLVRPKKTRRGLAAVAAAAAVALTGALTAFSLLDWETRGLESAGFDTSLSADLRLTEDRTLKIVLETPVTQEDYRPIHRVLVYEGEHLLQSITAEDVPESGEYLSEGLFINQADTIGQPDFRDINFDGYTDMGLLAVSSYPKNVPYHYFLWNPEDGRFEYGITLFGSAALQVDEERQMLVEISSDVYGVSQRYYRFENGMMKIYSVHPEGATVESPEPKFQIEYDTASLVMDQGVDSVLLCPKEYPDDLPICELEIEFLPGLLPSAAAEKTRLELWYPNISGPQRNEETGDILLSANNGNAWNSSVADVRLVSAGSQGTFRLTSRYFVEATEGWGARFAAVCDSFSCPLTDSPNPEAEKTAILFADAYFGRDWDTALSLLSSQTAADGLYLGDGDAVRIVSVSGLETLDDSIAQTGKGEVSLCFRESETEDSYTFLTMELKKSASGYRIDGYGLEK